MRKRRRKKMRRRTWTTPLLNLTRTRLKRLTCLTLKNAVY
jgi:hypothetical protein